MNFYLHLLRQR